MQFFWLCSPGDFEVSSIQINYNFQTQAHRDKANCGMSGMVTFGNFQGGKLRYWPLDGGQPEAEQPWAPEILDCRKLQFFVGRCLHGTEDFEGDRFSIVFFKIHNAENADLETQRELTQAGFHVKGWRAWA